MSQSTAPTGLIAGYRELFGQSGWPFVVIAAIARLPLAMAQLGTLLLVAGATGSYGAGGVSAGVLAVCNAVVAPLIGALTDRIGQRWVLLISSVAAAAALLGLVAGAAAGLPWPALAALAGLSGIALPQVGSLARVRWPLMINAATPAAGERRRRLETAFSYEGTADEASFMLGPALVGLGAALISPAGALVAAAVMIIVFGSAFALHPSAALTRPEAHAPATTPGGPVLTRALVLLLVAMLLMGTIFGSVQTGNSVLATQAGQPGLAGGLHALLGVGSVIAGFSLPALPPRFGLVGRYLAFAAAMVVLTLPLLVVGSIDQLPVLLVLLGLTVAPYMITVFTLAERVADRRRLGTVMTVLAGTIGLGYAIGSTAAGQLADLGGHRLAYAVTCAGAACALVLAVFGRRLLDARLATRPAAATASVAPLTPGG